MRFIDVILLSAFAAAQVPVAAPAPVTTVWTEEWLDGQFTEIKSDNVCVTVSFRSVDVPAKTGCKTFESIDCTGVGKDVAGHEKSEAFFVDDKGESIRCSAQK